MALKFMALKNEKALKEYLINKLLCLSNTNEPTQIMLLLFWSIEIIMNEMNQLKVNNNNNTLSTEYVALQIEFVY